MAIPEPLKVLIVGGGGREHALLQACQASPQVREVIAAPGNGGMAQAATCFPVAADDVPGLVNLAKEQAVSFVVVGPEVPLTLGLVDALAEVGIPAYGPNRVAAQLEGSKAFTKAFLERHHIPTAQSRTFSAGEIDELEGYLASQETPIVVKASGLAAGKGVIIAQTREEALKTARDMLTGKSFGKAGSEVVIEEFLSGEEASITLMVSGEKYVSLASSQDHKRAGEGDTGPNTGGMGAYAPAAVVTDVVGQEIAEAIIRPTLSGLATEGIDFRGTLYIGVMLTVSGPKVLEFNVRFGDPETQVLLPLCESDPVEILWDCAQGTLEPSEVRMRDGFAMTVVLAAQGYPGSYAKGEAIGLPDPIPEGSFIYHAGTKLDDAGQLVSNGGRVLNVTGRGATLAEAATKAYATCDQVSWPGKQLRRDIGWRQLAREG